MIAQGYVRTATGDITHTRLASDISSGPLTKYYSADETCIATWETVTEPIVRTTGKNNETLNFDEYAAVPICAQDGAAPGHRSVWIGLKFHKSLSNSLERSTKEIEYANFIRRSKSELHDVDPRSFRYLERVGRNADRRGFGAALRQAGVDIESPLTIVLIPHQEPFEQRSGDRLAWTFGSFAIGAVAWLGLVFLRPLDDSKVQRWLDPSRNTEDAVARGGLYFLVPNRRVYGLPILLDANILIFVAMVLAGLGFVSFDSQDLLTWGANYRPALHGLGVFRLITSEFVHAGIMHLLNNLYGLLFAGIFLLPVTGNAALVLCYLLCGLGGSIASAVVHPATVSVGASGAIFGLFGILLALLLLRDRRIAEVRQLVLVNVAIFVGVNLFLGAVSHGIDNAAHVGGLATGAILGLVIFMVKPTEVPRGSKAAD
jgi:rhomboid protease GluP